MTNIVLCTLAMILRKSISNPFFCSIDTHTSSSDPPPFPDLEEAFGFKERMKEQNVQPNLVT